MFSQVLLTVDFDRTLTDVRSRIPQNNLDAIDWFMARGGVFTLNTGRSVPMSNWFLDRVRCNAPLLLYNGSAAWDPEQGRWTQCHELDLDPETFVRDIEGRFPGLTVELQGPYAHHIFHKDAGWEDYCENNRCPWAYGDTGKIPKPFLKLAVYGEFRENTVASMYEATPRERELFDRAVEHIQRTYGDRVDVFRACARIADIHAKGCSKLASARALQKQLGRKVLVCVGDAQNDLTMLEGADYAYCPADGEVADRFENVCPCGEGAVAEVIYKKIPKILGLQP